MKPAIERRRGLACIWARVSGPRGGQRIIVAVDTGATRSLIRRAVLQRIGYDVTATLKTRPVITPSSEIQAPVMTVERIDACGMVRREIEVTCQALSPSLPIDGLLGLDFFGACRLTIDLRDLTLEID